MRWWGVLALCAGCDCWDADVRATTIQFAVTDHTAPTDALGTYAVEVAHRSGCGGYDDSGDSSSYEPIRGAEVLIHPVGEEPLALAEVAPGRYSGHRAGYGAELAASIEGVSYTYAAPSWIVANVAYSAGSGAIVTIDDAGSEDTAVSVRKPDTALYWIGWARDSLDIPDALFDAAGDYTIELVRGQRTEYAVFETGRVEVRTSLPLRIP